MSNRVLVVDDEPSILKLMRGVLMHYGYAVETASSVETARAALHGVAPALLIVDVTLGDGSGYDVAEFAVEAHPDIRVLAVSGISPLDPRASRWPILLKPFSMAYFNEVVSGLLQR